jgi:hypothetical protein
MQHEAGDERTGTRTVTKADAAAQLDRAAFLAYDEYTRELSLSPDTEVTVSFTTWENPFGSFSWDTAGRVTVSAPGEESHSYELAAASNTQWLYTSKKGSSERSFECREM